jgi:hypothetical protein
MSPSCSRETATGLEALNRKFTDHEQRVLRLVETDMTFRQLCADSIPGRQHSADIDSIALG